MSAYGIAGLVDGFFKGRQIKHGWEDRKDNKARQAKLDEFYAAEQGRAAERHDWARGDQGRKVSDYERALADEEAFRKANQDAIDATEAAMAEGTQPSPITPSTMGAPPRGPTTDAAAALPGAVDAATRRSVAAEQFERFFDPNDLGATPPPVTDGAPAGPRRADASITDTRRESIAENRASTQPVDRQQEELSAVIRENAILRQQVAQTQAAPAPSSGNPTVPPMNMPDNPRLLTEGPGPGGGMEQLFDQGILPRRYVGDPPAREKKAEQPNPAREAIMDRFRGEIEERLASGQPNYEHDWGRNGLGADAREAVNRGAAALGAVPRVAVNAAVDLNNAAVDLARPAVKYATGGENGFEIPYTPRLPEPQAALGAPPRPAAAPGPSNAPAAPAPAPAAAPGPRVSNVPANAPPAAKQLAAVADQAMGEASTPAIEATAAAVAKDDPGLGAAGNRPYSEKQRERASKAFMERYMEVGAPIVIKEYLRRGEIDKAQKFQEFLDQNETKAGMKNWARASFAASVGDFDSFATEIMEGYNRLDYFGDDTTIVTAESGFTDAEGNITKSNRDIAGAKIVFKDERTGKTFEQVYDSPEDIVTMGVTLLAPEEAFEYWVKKTEAAREAALGAAKGGVENQEKMAKAILDQANKIIENSKGLDGVPTKTQEEAEIEAEEMVRRLYSGAPRRADTDPLGAPSPEGAAPPGPPVMYRP